MIPGLIIAGIIVLIGAFFGILAIKNVRSTFQYSVGNHSIEVVTANLSVTLNVDGEEADKVTFPNNKWFNATVATEIDNKALIVKINRSTLLTRPQVSITFGGEQLDEQQTA